MSEPNFKHEQIQAIKKRLNAEKDKHGMKTTYKLAEALKEKTGFTDINYNTVKSALSFSTDALDITVVIAICRLFHLDTAYIMSPPGTPEPALPSDQTDTGKFKMLDDPKYFDTYYGYFYSPNHKSGELVQFELVIQSTDGKTTAVMNYHGRPRTVNGVVNPDERTLYGTPCLCTQHSNVYIQLTNDLGDFYYLYFNRQEFRSHNMYFRRGVALTASSLRNHPVIQLNFVLFANPYLLKNKYISQVYLQMCPEHSVLINPRWTPYAKLTPSLKTSIDVSSIFWSTTRKRHTPSTKNRYCSRIRHQWSKTIL